MSEMPPIEVDFHEKLKLAASLLPIEMLPELGGKPREESPLFKVSEPIEISKAGLAEAKIISERLVTFMESYKDLLGTTGAVAANQIGILKRVVILASRHFEPQTFVNPEIIESSGEQKVLRESCFSGLPNTVDVVRPATIRMKWFDLDGAEHIEDLDERLSRIMEHEIDHLNGKVCYDTKGTLIETSKELKHWEEMRNETLRDCPETK